MNKMKSLQLHKPHVIIVVGLPGAGKSFFATKFSEMFNAPYLDTGKYREAIGDEQAARSLAGDAFMQLLKTRQTLLVEGVANRLAERKDITRVAHKNGYDVLFVWVQTDPQSAEQRAVHSKEATLTSEQFEAQKKQFEPLTPSEKHVVISGKHTYASQAKMVLRKLVTDRKEGVAPDSGHSRPLPSRGRITIG